MDNSVMVPAFVEFPNSALAREVMTRHADWILPPLWQFEFTNVMATLVRSDQLDARVAHEAISQAKTAVIRREVPVDQGQVLRLAVRLGISGYDAQYLTLAEEYDAICVSADQALFKRASDRVRLLSSFQV